MDNINITHIQPARPSPKRVIEEGLWKVSFLPTNTGSAIEVGLFKGNCFDIAKYLLTEENNKQYIFKKISKFYEILEHDLHDEDRNVLYTIDFTDSYSANAAVGEFWERNKDGKVNFVHVQDGCESVINFNSKNDTDKFNDIMKKLSAEEQSLLKRYLGATND